jgi:nucleotide-binding universal stress UspA family protein
MKDRPFILAPTDFSDLARSAVREAAVLTERFGGRLMLLHVIPKQHATQGYDPSFRGARLSTAEGFIAIEDASEELEREAEQLRAAGLDAWGRVELGDPGTKIPELAQALGVDMIVMGTHGRTGLKKLFLGSVAQQTLESSQCPVLLMKEDHGSLQTAAARV